MAPNKEETKSALQVDNMEEFIKDNKDIPDNNCQGFEELQNEAGKVRLFLFSGSSPSQLKEKITSFLDKVKSSQSLEEVPRALEIKKEELFRHAILAESKERLVTLLEEAVNASEHAEVPSTSENKKLAFLVACQGCQFPQMGGKLYAVSPYFRKEFDECASFIEREYPDMRKFKHLITEEDETVNQEWVRDPQSFLPYTFVLEYVTYKLLTENWGLSPDYVMGLSFGDYMSALMTGILSLKDAINLIMTRCKLMTEQIKEEAFLAMEVNVDEYEQLLDTVRSEPGMEDLWVELACKNSPKQTCIVGKKIYLERLHDLCKSQGKKAMMNPHSLPYHSSLAAPVLPEFGKTTSAVTYGKTEKVQFISTLDGEIRDTIHKDYFLEHLVGPMNYIDAMTTLLIKERVTKFVEIGPHPLYTPWTKEIIFENMPKEECSSYSIMATFHRKHNDRVGFLNTAGRLFLSGYELKWDNVVGELEN